MNESERTREWILAQMARESEQRRAALLGIKPTVLARNLVRVGLAAGAGAEVAAAVDRIEAAIRDLRSLIP
jgi:hypothetical protein